MPAATPLEETPLDTLIAKFNLNCGGLSTQQAINLIGTLIANSVSNGLGVRQKQSSNAPSNFAIATANATVFTLADGEVGFIQNLDDEALAVKLGATASPTSLSVILQGGDAADDGRGGFLRIDDHIGAVSVCAMSGTARYIAWKKAI